MVRIVQGGKNGVGGGGFGGRCGGYCGSGPRRTVRHRRSQYPLFVADAAIFVLL